VQGEHPAKPGPPARVRAELPSARQPPPLQDSLTGGLYQAASWPGSATGFVSVVLRRGFGNRASPIVLREAGKAAGWGSSGDKGPRCLSQTFGRV